MKTCLTLLATLACAAPAWASEPAAPQPSSDDAEARESAALEPVAPSVPTPAVPPFAPGASAPAATVPRPETLTLELGSRTLFVRDDAYGVFSSRRALGVGGFALRAPVYRDDAWTYAAGLSLEGQDDVRGSVRSVPVAIDVFRAVARGEVSFAATRYLTAYGSVGVGAESIEFRYGSASEAAWSKTWSPTGELGLGLGAHAQVGWARIGLRLDGGYALAKSHALRVTQPEVGDVVRQPVDLGTLSTSAPFARVALQLGF